MGDMADLSVRLPVAGSAAALLLLIAGCGLMPDAKRDRQPEATKALQLAFCSIKSGQFLDDNNDAVVSVGDRITYVVRVALAPEEGTPSCTNPTGNFYGAEQIVERREVGEGHAQFLTDLQGTVMLPDGNLRLMAMGTIQITDGELSSMVRSGSQRFATQTLFPGAHPLSVQGQGGQFAGLIGSAQLKTGNPPVLEVRLFPQVTLSR